MTIQPKSTLGAQKYRNTFLFVLFILALGIYVFTIPQDFSDAEDALWFAHDIETLPFGDLFHPFHLLYLPLMKVIYSLGLFDRAYTLLLYTDKILGLFTLFLFYLLLKKRFQLSTQLALIGAILLGVSYGFWRYSNTGEVYIIACLLSVAVALVSFSDPMDYKRSVYSGVLGAAALLMHPINLTLVCVALPVRFMLAGKIRALVIYCAVTSLLVVSAYFAAYGPDTIRLVNESGASLQTTTLQMSIPRNIIGLGETIVSGNFLFGYPAFVSSITSLFPGRMLHEEIFNGQRAGFVSRIVPLATLCGLAVIGVMILYGGMTRKGELRPAIFRNKNILTISLWLVSYIAFMMLWEPGEGWIMCLVPLWGFATPVLLEPVYRKTPVLVVLLALFLFVHNYTGGILLRCNKENDYVQKKSEWYTHNTSEDDLILSLDKGVYDQYLRYFTKAKVINLFSLGKSELEDVYEALNTRGGNVYATDDVLYPPQWYAHTDSEHFSAAEGFAKRVGGEFEKIVSNETGGIYVRRR